MTANINKVFSGVLAGRGIKIVLIVLAAIYLVTMYNRYIQADENWFGEQAYWLLKEGKVKLKSIPLIFNWDTEFLVYHKLLVWFGAGIIKVFGWSVYPLKAFNLLCFIVCLLLIRKYLANESSAFKYLLMAIVLLTPLSLVKSFEFRPEVPVMMFGFASFLFLSKYLDSGRIIQICIAGLLAGLAFLVHLNGAIFCVTGVLVLLWYKKLKGAIVFSLIAIPVCFIYFLNLLEGDNFAQWAYNLKNWPSHNFSRAVDQNILITIVDRIISEQKRFFWNGEVAGISVLFFASLILKGKYLWNNHRVLILYTTSQILLLALLGSHKAPRYLMFHVPFMALVIAYTIKNIAEQDKAWAKISILVLLLAQVVFLMVGAAHILRKNNPHASKHEEVLSHIPQGASLIGPWELIYNGLENHQIYSYRSYEYLEEKMPVPFTQEQVSAKIDSMQIEYIVIDEDMKTNDVYHWFPDWEISEKIPFKEYYRGEDYLILKKQ